MKCFHSLKFNGFSARLSLLIVSIFSFVTLIGVSVGMGQAMDMSMDGMPNMNCIFDDGSGCAMNFNEHLALWEQVFTANVFNWRIEFILLMTLLVPFFFASLMEKTLSFFVLPGAPPLIYYERKNSMLKLFDPVLQALSNGILQPKIHKHPNF